MLVRFRPARADGGFFLLFLVGIAAIASASETFASTNENPEGTGLNFSHGLKKRSQAAVAGEQQSGRDTETKIRGNGARNLTASCDSYHPIQSGTTTTSIFWTGNGGPDTEWLNVANWATNFLPGTDRFNRLIMAVNDHGTVWCPTTYTTHGVELEMRSGATLDVKADLTVVDELHLKTNARLTQGGQSVVAIGLQLNLAAAYDLSDQARLVVGRDVYCPLSGSLHINGGAARVEVGTLDSSSVNSQFHGILTFVLGPSGAGTFVVEGTLEIGSGARLVVDASAYEGGAATIPLILFGSSTGWFDPSHVTTPPVVSGLDEDAGISWEIQSLSDGVYLEILQDGGGGGGSWAPTSDPTADPVAPNSPVTPTDAPVAPSEAPSEPFAPTAAPVASPTPAPTALPTPAPIVPPTPAPTSAPTATQPTNSPTLMPTASPVECTGDADCDDGNECTIDICQGVSGCDNSLNACGTDEICSNKQCVAASTNPPPTNPPTTNSLPADPVDAIPEFGEYTLVYELDPIPLKPNFAEGVAYTQADLDQPPFSRVAYFMELDGPDYGHQWVWVSVDAFTDDVSFTGIPCPSCGQGTIQQSLSNVNVESNVVRLGGTSLDGNIEFWPFNYAAANTGNVPGASDDVCDSGDSPAVSGNYGSMQVHVSNGTGPRQTVFAFNKFNKGTLADLGIGNKPGDGGQPDWTFSSNTGAYITRKLRVYVKEQGPMEPTVPTLPQPTIAPADQTPSPTSSPATSAPVSPMTTVITMDSSGVASVTPAGVNCPSDETNDLLIDGAAFAGGAGTFTLYQCATGVGFDPMRIKLINFPKELGLWYEIKDGIGGNVNLVIKSLADYTEYPFRNRYTNIPYAAQLQEEQTHFPGFSWDTVPKWINYKLKGINKEFNDTEIEWIADTNNYISWHGLVSPEESKTLARRIKEKNPDYKQILYWNSYGAWYDLMGTTGDPYPGFKEEWWAYDMRNGRKVYKVDAQNGNRRLFNHEIPEFRDWWIAHAVLLCADSNIDGVFVDSTRSDEGSAHASMIEELMNTLPAGTIKLGNFLRQADMLRDGNRWRMPYSDGSYLENVHFGPNNQKNQYPGQPIIVSMQLAREALWKGKIIFWNGAPFNCNVFNDDILGACPSVITREEMSEYIKPTLAEFLIVVEKYAYFNFMVTTTADYDRYLWETSWMDEFNRHLGNPLGPPVKVGNKFSRHFEGVSVVFTNNGNGADEGTYEWK